MKKRVTAAIIIMGTATVSIFADAPSDMNREMLERHNALREKHGAPAMKWSMEAQKTAQEWANKIAREDRMYHRNPNKYGENIYWISGGTPSGASVVDSWYSEIKDYRFSRPGFSYQTGHFTQVVWKGSTELGCGTARSRRGGLYVVCNYNPPGNYMRRFPENVLPAKKENPEE